MKNAGRRVKEEWPRGIKPPSARDLSAFQLLFHANNSKERHLKTEHQEADGDVSLDPIFPGQIVRPALEGALDLPETPLHLP